MNIRESDHIAADLGIPTWTQNQRPSERNRRKRLSIQVMQSIASCFFSVAATGVTVLSAVGRIRRNIWSEVQALQCPQRARMVFYASQGPLSQPPAPSPRRA